MSEEDEILQIGEHVLRTVHESWKEPAAAYALTPNQFGQVKLLQAVLQEEFEQEYELDRVVRVYKRTRFVSSW